MLGCIGLLLSCVLGVEHGKSLSEKVPRLPLLDWMTPTPVISRSGSVYSKHRARGLGHSMLDIAGFQVAGRRLVNYYKSGAPFDY